MSRQAARIEREEKVLRAESSGTAKGKAALLSGSQKRRGRIPAGVRGKRRLVRPGSRMPPQSRHGRVWFVQYRNLGSGTHTPFRARCAWAIGRSSPDSWPLEHRTHSAHRRRRGPPLDSARAWMQLRTRSVGTRPSSTWKCGSCRPPSIPRRSRPWAQAPLIAARAGRRFAALAR